MTITDVIIRKTFDEPQLKAIVSVVFDNCFALHDIKIVNNESKIIVSMPSYKDQNGRHRDIAHPMSSDFRKQLNETILNAYFEYKNNN